MDSSQPLPPSASDESKEENCYPRLTIGFLGRPQEYQLDINAMKRGVYIKLNGVSELPVGSK